MNFRLNGENIPIKDQILLTEIIKNKNLKIKNIVIELNEKILKKDEIENIRICENDVLEILSFVGGGWDGRFFWNRWKKA